MMRLAVVVAAIAVFASRAPAQTTQLCTDCSLGLQLPVIASIAIVGDTTWFCGEIDGQTSYLANYLWVRGAPLPQRVGSPAKTPCDRSVRRTTARRDTHGIALTRVTPPKRGGRATSARSAIRLIDSTNRDTIDLRPRFSPRVLARIHGEELGTDTVGTTVSECVADDSVAWIGLDGGFGDGGGTLGGLYRVNRRTKAFELITNAFLDNSRVTGMVSTPPWLWLGTDSPSEYFTHGESGLLRLDVRTRAWRQYTNTNSPLPDALIRALASDGRILAVATEDGLAVAELRSGALATRTHDDAIAGWHVGYFNPGFAGDSLVFDVGPTHMFAVDTAASPLWTKLQHEAPRGHERPMYAMLTDPVTAAARPAGVAALVAMLSVPGDKQSLAAAAVERMGRRAPTVVIDALRAQFAHADTLGQMGDNLRISSRTALGVALSAVGDSTGVTWSRTTLENAIQRGSPQAELGAIDMGAAAEILTAVHDRAGLALLIRAAPFVTGGSRSVVVSQITLYDEPAAWDGLITLARDGALGRFVLNDLRPSALRDSAVADHVRQYLVDVLAGDQPLMSAQAANAVRRLRLIELAPALVRRLQPDQMPRDRDAVDIIIGLVSLSGRSDAPVFHGPSPPKPVLDWWERWLASSKGTPRAVSSAAGDAAAAQWRSRFEAAQRGGGR